MDIQFRLLSYEQVGNGLTLDNDNYGVGAYTVGKEIIDTLFANPSLSKDEPMIIFALVDGIIVGRSMKFPNRLKIGERIIKVSSGSSLFVEEHFRHLALGAQLFMMSQRISKRPILNAGISTMAVPLYEKTRFTLFRTPIKWQIRNVKPVLQKIGVNGFLVSLFGGLGNLLLMFYKKSTSLLINTTVRQFEINRFDSIPQWAEDIVLKDEHKYAELHDREWMQWVLNHNFFNKSGEAQYFYGIFKDGKPLGFCMLSERVLLLPSGGDAKAVFGTLTEWGTVDESQLNEYQIAKIALSLFSNNVDIVNIATNNKSVRKKLSKLGLFCRGSYIVAFKDISKEIEEDYKNINNWRIRMSYSDTSFY